MLEHKLIKNYLQINAFLDLVVVEQDESSYVLQKKATGGAAVSVERDAWLDTTGPDF